jgi:hypothetical protein
VTWDYLQYVLGLARLGHDVYYLEDSGQWPYDRRGGASGSSYVVTDCRQNVDYLEKVMVRFDLASRWAYRCPIDSRWYGLTEEQRLAVIESADLLLNVSGSLVRPQEYGAVRRLAYIDSDPVFTQVKLARGQENFCREVDAHEVHFSFGECLSGAVPATPYHWQPTRQPIVLSEWSASTPPREVITTVMNWTSYNPVACDGRIYGQKDLEFERFLELPERVAPTSLEIAVKGTRRRRVPERLLTYKGWRLVDPLEVCPDLDSYRRYIQASKAEWSVAKHGYVVGRPGWFSCRSACYLAAGRPVVVQDTGFCQILPTGEGILPFQTMEEAVAAIREVEAHYGWHAAAARQIAEAYFDSDQVLTRLIELATADIPSQRSEEVRH